MVLPDLSWVEDDKKQFHASAVDRFFSFIIDYLIFSPVVSFFLLMIMQDSVRIFRERIIASETILVLLILSFCFIALFSFLQSLFVYYWGGTPGQVFLKLSVKPKYDRHFLFLRIFIRQLGFWFSLALLGLPWLQVLLHPKQQTFYDRIADLEIMTNKAGDNTLFKFDNEVQYWRSTYVTMVIFLIILASGFIWNQHSKIITGIYAFKNLEKKNYFCHELSDLKPSDRLQIAIALNLVGQLSDACLDQEANFSLWRSRESSSNLAYYAKSLTTEDKVEEDEYLKLTCLDKSSNGKLGCALGEAFLTADFSGLMEHLSQDKIMLATVIKYEFSVKGSKYQQELLSELSSENKNMKKYVLTERLDLMNFSNGRRPASANDSQFAKENKEAIDRLISEL